MSKAIFTTKISSIYNDRPEEYYQFPRTYLAQARSAIGDHIIYYEPRRLSGEDSSRGGKQAYFATAKVDDVTEDRTRPDYYYAKISGYLSFDRRSHSLRVLNIMRARFRNPTALPIREHLGEQLGLSPTLSLI